LVQTVAAVASRFHASRQNDRCGGPAVELSAVESIIGFAFEVEVEESFLQFMPVIGVKCVQCSSAWYSSHFSFDAARTNLRNFPLGCRPWPPNLPLTRTARDFVPVGERARLVVIVEGLTDDSSPMFARLRANSASTWLRRRKPNAPVTWLRGALSPRPNCTEPMRCGRKQWSEPEIGTMVRSPTGYPIQSPYLAMANSRQS